MVSWRGAQQSLPPRGVGIEWNWVRFAQSPSAEALGRRVEGRGRTARPSPGKLGSFCAFGLRCPPPGDLFQSAIRNRGLPGPQIGFVLHVSLPGRAAPHDDGLCPHTPVCPSLASFCTIPSVRRPRRGEIGFVLHARPVCSDAVRRFFAACTSRPRSGGTQDAHGSQCPDGHTTGGDKFEARISKSETSSNDRNSKVPNRRRPAPFSAVCIVGYLNLFRISCFGFRISRPPAGPIRNPEVRRADRGVPLPRDGCSRLCRRKWSSGPSRTS
jgi:hypothetical protein